MKLLKEIHRRSLWQVLGIYIVGGWVALQVVDTLASTIGLPAWFGPVALGLLIVGLPIVVVYRMSPATYAIGRRLVGLEDVALPNLVAGRRIVPELIQHDYTADNVARRLAHWLDDTNAAAETRETLRGLRSRLAGSEAFGMAADRVLAELSSSGACAKISRLS